jgi:hypothetical protein
MDQAESGSENYGVSAAGYLSRVRARLLEADKACLFYAALELRCCVEARQAEYIEHLSAFKGKKVRPYRIGENREKIAKISGGKLIAKLTFDLSEGRIFEAFHTPVPASLTRFCERSLDSLRHAQRIYRKHDDPWWETTRNLLIENYRLAWISCQGNLLVPPLWSSRSGQTHPMVFELDEKDRAFMETIRSSSAGDPFQVHVEYLESPPRTWVCDL